MAEPVHRLHSEPVTDHRQGQDGLAWKTHWTRENILDVGDSSSMTRAQDLESDSPSEITSIIIF